MLPTQASVALFVQSLDLTLVLPLSLIILAFLILFSDFSHYLFLSLAESRHRPLICLILRTLLCLLPPLQFYRQFPPLSLRPEHLPLPLAPEILDVLVPSPCPQTMLSKFQSLRCPLLSVLVPLVMRRPPTPTHSVRLRLLHRPFLSFFRHLLHGPSMTHPRPRLFGLHRLHALLLHLYLCNYKHT